MAKLESASLEAHLPQPISRAQQPSPLAPKKQVKEPAPVYQTPVPEQLNLFVDESAFLRELQELELNNMTPLQSQAYLHDLIKRLES